jgi:hypothetical protein
VRFGGLAHARPYSFVNVPSPVGASTTSPSLSVAQTWSLGATRYVRPIFTGRKLTTVDACPQHANGHPVVRLDGLVERNKSGRVLAVRIGDLLRHAEQLAALGHVARLSILRPSFRLAPKGSRRPSCRSSSTSHGRPSTTTSTAWWRRGSWPPAKRARPCSTPPTTAPFGPSWTSLGELLQEGQGLCQGLLLNERSLHEHPQASRLAQRREHRRLRGLLREGLRHEAREAGSRLPWRMRNGTRSCSRRPRRAACSSWRRCAIGRVWWATSPIARAGC